jgi:hypothetical protein
MRRTLGFALTMPGGLNTLSIWSSTPGVILFPGQGRDMCLESVISYIQTKSAWINLG